MYVERAQKELCPILTEKPQYDQGELQIKITYPFLSILIPRGPKCVSMYSINFCMFVWMSDLNSYLWTDLPQILIREFVSPTGMFLALLKDLN